MRGPAVRFGIPLYPGTERERRIKANLEPWVTKMTKRWLVLSALILAFGCATESVDDEPRYDPLDDYQEVDAKTILDAPDIDLEAVAMDSRDAVMRGKYMIELLGCGACHTDGALVGTPDFSKSLAGSSVGIAYTNPLEYVLPGVVYPANLTPDVETGLGGWSDAQIIAAIRAGQGQHGERLGLIMPWGGYALISDEDITAIVAYLRNIEPVRHRVPTNVEPGMPATDEYVHFGVYQSR